MWKIVTEKQEILQNQITDAIKVIGFPFITDRKSDTIIIILNFVISVIVAIKFLRVIPYA